MNSSILFVSHTEEKKIDDVTKVPHIKIDWIRLNVICGNVCSSLRRSDSLILLA